MRVWLIICCFFLVSCDQKLMDGWSELEDNVYFKIHTLGDGEQKAGDGDKIFAQLDIYGASGKLIYRNNLSSGALHRFNVSSSNSIWNKMFMVMHEGDSATFSMNGNKLDLAKLTQDKVVSYPEELTLAVKIWRLETHRDQLANNMKEAPADLELLELNNLKTYLDSNNLTDKFHFVDGIFVQYIKRGNGAKVQSGQSIWINYKGQFLNGKEFDNTYKRGQMLDFQLGKPDQVIRGFEIALSKMNEGDKVRLYLPSSYAFGGQGSSNGQVPPFTSVMYELELYKISS